MANWTKKKLRDICDRVDYGFTASATKAAIGPKFLRITDIVPSHIDWENVPFCKISETDKSKYLLTDGDIVIARTGATTGYAKCLKNPPESVFASYLVRFRVSKSHDKRFVGHVIQSDSYKKFITKNLGGAAQPQANAQILGSYELSLPEKQIQTHIASILSAYDDLIENNGKRIKTLEEMAQRLYTEWFVKFKFPGHEKVKMVDCRRGYGRIPEEWKVIKLYDKFQIILGGTPSRNNKNNWMNGNVPWINSGKVNELRITEESEMITTEALRKSATKLMPKRTTLLAITGATLGQVSLTEIECCANQSVVGIYDEENLFNEFIYLKIKEIIKTMIALAGGGAQQHINKEIVNNTEIIMPNKEIMHKFSYMIIPIFDEIAKLLFSDKCLAKIRDLLIPQLVTGKRELK